MVYYVLDLNNLKLFHNFFYSILLLLIPISLKGNVCMKNVGEWEKGMCVRDVWNLLCKQTGN